MATLDEAKQARDLLVDSYMLSESPNRGITGIGVALEDGGYVVAVDTLDNSVSIPAAALGVPVRVRVSGIPRALDSLSPQP